MDFIAGLTLWGLVVPAFTMASTMIALGATYSGYCKIHHPGPGDMRVETLRKLILTR
jgi:hypothetical protein